MATKKQKRLAAQAKREAFMAEVEAVGLAALKKSREMEEARREQAAAEAQKVNARVQSIMKSAYIMNQVH